MKAKRTLIVFACALAIALPASAFAAAGSDAGTAADTAKDEAAVVEAAAEDEAEEEKADGEEAEAEEAAPTTASDELVAWAEGMPCEACHVDEAASYETESSMAKHAAFATSCVMCHIDDALIEVHNDIAGKDMPTKVKKTKVSVAVCETCHTWEALEEATADSTVLKDNNDTVVNPHGYPDVEQHQDMTCVKCHKMHSDKPAKKQARKVCQGCHHANVFECYTCHA